MSSRLYQEAENGVLTELLAGLQAMETFHQYKAIAVAAHQDRRLLADLENAFGDRIDNFGVERCPPFHRHVNARYGEFLTLQHGLLADAIATSQRAQYRGPPQR
jgi:hypothetical protein